MEDPALLHALVVVVELAWQVLLSITHFLLAIFALIGLIFVTSKVSESKAKRDYEKDSRGSLETAADIEDEAPPYDYLMVSVQVWMQIEKGYLNYHEFKDALRILMNEHPQSFAVAGDVQGVVRYMRRNGWIVMAEDGSLLVTCIHYSVLA